MQNGLEEHSVTEITIENIGGIDEASLEFGSGVTALVGENATNRTSIIQAIAAGLGVDKYSLKSDSDSGRVQLSVAGETYTREFWRENGTVQADGEPYLENPEVAELYGVLVRSNAIRQAVRDRRDLRELILAPVDTEEIQQRISECIDERRRVDDELDRLDALADRLTEYRTKREETKQELDDLERRLDEKQAELEAVEDSRHDGEKSDRQQELDETLTELSDARSKRQRVSANLASERKSLESLRDSKATVEEQYESLSPPDEGRLAALEGRIESLREQKQTVTSTISELQQVIRFNENRLSGSDSGLGQALESDDEQAVTDELDPSTATTTCWTCGSRVERSNIEETLDRLKSLRERQMEEKNRIENELADVQDELDGLEQRRDELEQLRSELDSLERKIEQREANIEEFEQRQARLVERIETLKEEVDTLQSSQQDELLTLQEEVSELTFERDETRAELDRLEDNIASLEEELEEREDLRRRRAELSEELDDLRTRIDRIEREAIEEFNGHMSTLVDRLDYDNIDRIWMERTEEETRDGRQKTTRTRFDLHVVRETDSGEAYEDTVDTLSESERELIGLVVALTGYIVHDVHEEMPFMLLDSVEMIDGNRLVELVSYLQEYVPYLVVVLLPDHARTFEEATLPQSYQAVEI